MLKKIIISFLALAAIVSLAVFLTKAMNKPEDSSAFLKLSLKPVKGDFNGMEKGSGFVLRANKKLSKGEIKKNIKFEPALDFKVKEKKLWFFASAGVLAAEKEDGLKEEYQIVPEKELDQGVTYVIKTATSTDLGLDHDYSWAFKIKEDFGIKDSLPSDSATGVPVDTGIEMNMNRFGIKEVEKYFEIRPAIKGKFEIDSDKITFIPEGDLKAKTLYTITLKKGLAAGEEKLAQDKEFAFETAAGESQAESPDLHWSNDFFEMSPGKTGFLEASGNATSSKVTVMRYRDSAGFLKDYYKYEARANDWSEYNKESFQPEQAEEILNFQPELLNNEERLDFGLIRLPKELEIGFYVLRLSVKDQADDFAFVRVSDLAYYFTEINGDGLVWAYDFADKKPYAGLSLFMADKEGVQKNLGKTDENGLIRFDSSSSKDDNSGYSFIFKGQNFQETAVPDVGRIFESRKNYFQGYLNTDRYAYRLSDKLHFWGVVKGRSFDLRQKKVKISLDDYIVKEATVSSFDTIQGEMDFQGLSFGYHNLIVSYNDETITQASIEVFPFEKPLYKIDIETDKTFSTVGKPVKAKIKVNFFDGTPAENMNLRYSITWRDGSDKEGIIKTDGSGEAVLEYTPEYFFEESSDSNTEYWTTYPLNLRFMVKPESAEEGDIWGEAYVNIYAPKSYISSEQADNDPKAKEIIFKAKINGLDLENEDENEIIGKPLSGQKVKVKVIRYYYEPILVGEKYDAVEKKKIKNYDYLLRKNTIKEAEGVTDQKGEWQIGIDKNISKDNGYLKAIFSAEDSEGKKIMSSSESYNYYPYNSSTYLSLNNLDQKRKKNSSYKTGEKINLQALLAGEQKAVDDRTLFVSYQEGLRNVVLANDDSYTDIFAEKYQPSMSYRAIKIMPEGFLESDAITVSLDEAEKRLKVDVGSDKAKYKPREKINLSIKIRDRENNGLKAVANVAAVDEALFNVTPWVYGAEILDSFYSDIMAWPSSLSTRYVLKFKSGAEKGGCFVGDTKILMGDGTEKNIQDIRVGDEIMTFENEDSLVARKSIVQGISSHEVNGYLVINDNLKLTPEHRILINGSWNMAGNAKLGDHLVTAAGKSEKIGSIRAVKANNIKVYNMIVGKYHTYIADGYYVHNAEKGGGGDPRNFFQDTPLYKQIESDENGNIETSFEAPDNLTSWRVTVNAYDNENMNAGANNLLVPVGLPLFVDAVMAKQYLSGDQPSIKIRVFGSDYQQGKPVEIKVKSDSLKLDYSATTTADKIELDLGKLPAGKHRLIISAKQDKLQDMIERNIEAVENHLKKYETADYPIDPSLKNMKGNDKGFTELIFVDEGKGKYFDRLLDHDRSGSMRSDISAAVYLASKTLNDYFYGGKEQFYADIDLSRYQNHNNGSNLYSLFPYGSADYDLSSKLVDAMPDKMDSETIVNAFNAILEEKKSSIKEVSMILYGLSSLRQPVLPFINYLKENASTTPEAKIYLALALYKIGDSEGSREIYTEELLPRLKYDNDSAYFETGGKADMKATAALGLLSSYLEKEPENGRLKSILNYLKNNQPKNDSTALEEVMIIKNEIAKEDKNDSSFSYQTKDRNGKIDLSQGRTAQLTLSGSELQSLTFSEIKGKPKVVVYQEKFAAPEDLAKSNLIKVNKRYMIDGKEAAEIKDGDLVDIRIDPVFAKEAADDSYQIVDYLPAGLKPVIREYSIDIQPVNDCDPIWYPIRMTDEAVYFNIGKWFEKTDNCAHRTINYRARVVNKGKFKAQGTTIQSLNDPDISNIDAEKMIIIK